MKNNIQHSFCTPHFNESKAARSKDAKNIHIYIPQYSQKANPAKQSHIMRHLCVTRSRSLLITSVSNQMLHYQTLQIALKMQCMTVLPSPWWVAGSRFLGESVRKIAISRRAALAAVRQGHGKPLTQLELHTTLWQLYLRQEVVHTAHFNPSGVDSWALLLVCPQPWPARSSPHWLPAAARIPNPSLWQPPWSFFLNKPVHNNWELGRADNYFFFWDKISPAALVAKNGRGEVPDDLQYLRELHAKGVRWIGDEGTHVGALLPHFLRSALVRDRSLRTGPAPT